jgi:sugar diacid utilization regulator
MVRNRPDMVPARGLRTARTQARAANALDGRPVRQQLSALSSLLILSACQGDQASIAPVVASAVEAVGPCRAEGILLAGRWQDIRFAGQEPGARDLGGVILPVDGGRVDLAGVPWAWAYLVPDPHGTAGYLLVGAAHEPAQREHFLLQILARQAGAAFANARLSAGERDQTAELQRASHALRRSRQIHDRLTQVARQGEGQEGIARAVHDLTACPVAIEDRFGNLRAWAGPGRPDPYPKDDPVTRDALLRRAVAAAGPVRDGERLVSVALLAGAPAGVLAVSDPGGRAGGAEQVAIEHATTVLAMEIAFLQGSAETDIHLRSKLVLDLVAGADEPGILNRAQALGYDLGRRHRVLVVEGSRGEEDIDAFFRAVSRAAADVQAGSLLAARQRDVIVLADAERPWERFRTSVAAELHGGRCRIGVGGACHELSEFPRSYREAGLALRIQEAVRGREQVTEFEQLGVYRVLGTAGDASAMERFAREWLGTLMDYDVVHGTQLVITLSEHLDCGGNYDSSARALSVHRSTVKYRLKRIREVSGHDLATPDTQFNLQLAIRAWRTLQALRDS